jgi:hypothetical protein
MRRKLHRFAIHVTPRSAVFEAATIEGFDRAIDALLVALTVEDG